MSTTTLAPIETGLIQVIDGQIVIGHELRLALDALRKRAEAIESVHDKTSYAEAMEIAASGKADVKAITAAAEPERLRLAKALTELRTQRDKVIAQVEEVFGPVEKLAREWNISERDAAKKEQDKLNKGQRAENRVTVQPHIPTVPGARVVVHYRFEVKDISKVNRKFLMIDAVKVNDELRHDKDPERTARTVGGIRAWKE